MEWNKTYHRRKICVIFAGVALCGMVLLGRLVYLMLFRGDYYSGLATELQQRERKIKAARGKILDRNGKVLAGLKRRRAAEQALFNKPVSTATPAQNTESEDYNMKTIKKGSKGNAVKVWQIIIGAAADGIFGSGTESATKTWQSNHGLAADGIVGKMSWKAGLEAL